MPPEEGLGLCKISLGLVSKFDAEELDCGGDGVEVEAEGGCNKLALEAETDNGWYCSTVVGNDGVWGATGPVPWLAVARRFSVGVSPGRPLRRRCQRNTQKRMRRRPADAPTTIPPIVPPLSLEEFNSVISPRKSRNGVLTKTRIQSYRHQCRSDNTSQFTVGL